MATNILGISPLDGGWAIVTPSGTIVDFGALGSVPTDRMNVGLTHLVSRHSVAIVGVETGNRDNRRIARRRAASSCNSHVATLGVRVESVSRNMWQRHIMGRDERDRTSVHPDDVFYRMTSICGTSSTASVRFSVLGAGARHEAMDTLGVALTLADRVRTAAAHTPSASSSA